ncbi:MAG TPA: hypothetical protein VKA10_09905 [Prolixibacteraceae bacterium]|nr:hypothetical protein [Prolixibacteraceae bacterium]
MKNSHLFKTLIDILFFLHVLGLFALILWFPIDIFSGANAEHLHLWEWIILTLYCVIYLIFLRGLFFMRKTAGKLLQNKIFTKYSAYSTMIGGYHFIIAGILLLLIILSKNLFQLNFESLPKSFSITPIFLIMIGLFFTIQSEILLKAIDIKSENDLMI